MPAVIHDSSLHVMIEAPENMNHIEGRNRFRKARGTTYIDKENGDLPFFTHRSMSCCLLSLVGESGVFCVQDEPSQCHVPCYSGLAR